MISFFFVAGFATASMIEVLSDDNAKQSIKAEIVGSDLMISQELISTKTTDNKAFISAISVLERVPEEFRSQILAGQDIRGFESFMSTFLQIANCGCTVESSFRQNCRPKGVGWDTEGEACGWT